MGRGIAQKAATSGYEVTLIDTNQEVAEQAEQAIRGSLDRAVARGKVKAEVRDATLDHLTFAWSHQAAAEADIVIEAVFEDLTVKQRLFRDVVQIVGSHTILASNTSSLGVKEVFGDLAGPERCVGLHFFFPAHINRLLEIIPGRATSPETLTRMRRFGARNGKILIHSGDAAGFVVNRFFVPWLNESARLFAEGLGSPATIDAVAKETFGVGMGPFALMNATGIPIAYHSMASLQLRLGPFYAVADGLRTQFEKGAPWELGEVEPDPDPRISRRLRAAVFTAAVELVDQGVATLEDVDLGAQVGLAWPRGPFKMMDDMGLAATEAETRLLSGRAGMPELTSLKRHIQRGQPWGSGSVRWHRDGHVAWIRIVRPTALNALNPDVLKDLRRCIRDAAADPEVRCAVLTGIGRSFVAGADIKHMIKQTSLESRDFTLQGQATLRLLEEWEVPVIGAINGYALGGGLELALACDFLVASDQATFGLPETGLGIHPGFGGTQRLPRLIGPARAKELLFTGRQVGAEEALAIGLVVKVFPHIDLEAGVGAMANVISSKGPYATRLAKAVMNRGLQVDLETGLALEVESVSLTFGTRDQQEGMEAFLAKREPRWQGE